MRVIQLSVACVAVLLKRTKPITLALLVMFAFAANVTAAPILLECMGIQKQWTDSEAATNEMPGFVWGDSDTALADKIGLHVLFADGTEGSIAYSGVSPHWNTSGTPFGTLISANGFFSSYATAGLHFLYNVPAGGTLPIAWLSNPLTPFGNNVELDYFDNAVNSEFRVTTAGWESVEITTYSSSAVVPEPSSIVLFGLGTVGLIFMGRRQRKRKLTP